MDLKTEVWTPQNGAARVMDRCDELARCSEEAGRLTRTFLSPALAKAHEMVGGWMREAGLLARVDALGNLRGHFSATKPNAPLWILGSHLDTVPNAGKYDGMLGVLLAIETVASLESALPFEIEVIGFSDEEGVRFKTPYLGSRALAGSFDPNFLELCDPNGVSMRRAMGDFGLHADAWPNAGLEKVRVVGYFEAHIEQGPVLESLGAPLGIVSAIAGQSRVRLRFRGQPGHAGTLPMNGRRDALAAASEWILEVENVGCQTPGLMATVGYLEVVPNTANVVPGEVLCSLDVRHAADATRQNAVSGLLGAAQNIARRRGVMRRIDTSQGTAAAWARPQRQRCQALGGVQVVSTAWAWPWASCEPAKSA